MTRPDWMPSLTDLERECLKALVATLFVAVVVSHVPPLRKFLVDAWMKR